MNIETEQILLALIILMWIDIFIVLRTLSNKAELTLSAERRSRELAELAHLFEIDSEWDKKKVHRLMDNYLHLKQSIDLPAKDRERLLELARSEAVLKKMERRIRSPSRHSRMEAAIRLALIPSERSRLALEKALASERNFPVKLFFANALADLKDPRSIDPLVQSLLGAHRWYRDKVNLLIASFGLEDPRLLQPYFERRESEIVELLIDIAGRSIREDVRDYLLQILERGQDTIAFLSRSIQGCPEKSCAYCAHGRTVLDDFRRSCPFEGEVRPDFRCGRFSPLVTLKDPVSNHHRLLVKAAETLEKFYSNLLWTPFFLGHSDAVIRRIAIRSLGKGKDQENVDLLLEGIGEEENWEARREGLSRILAAHPRFIPFVVQAFQDSTSDSGRQRIAEVLAGRIEYFIGRLRGRERNSASMLIREVVRLGKVSEIIEFLKTNKDIGTEDAVLAVLSQELPESELLRSECALYLPERVLAKCGISRLVPQSNRRSEKRDWKMVRSLYAIIAVAVGFFPLLYILRYADRIRYLPFTEQLKTFVVDFNYDFAWYSLAVNGVYLLLLGLSVVKVRSSTRLWNLKTMSMLFKPRMLPSVSIIAPAYNEERTILESVNSLLNLKYPDYELVVVNDGSRDSTLDTLISCFGLKRSDYSYAKRLKTAPVRGIYLNPLYPRLVVVDKENGGKADSLNAGINVASREYFCGIDADSLLEPDALLKVAALTLDYGVETPAMGGNIFPINGCAIDRGKLMDIALPRNNLAKLQTIEYMRAFMCGRLGWAQLNSLLIISGAFGLFRKERVVSIGGYLTSNERFQKDTVGEDMELVVRIARLMREKRQPYRISYAYNANCWTEVPETLKVLKRQRDRWHRGLIDIMYFHRKLVFNPSYGRMGLLGMPYFLIFELVGPLFEIQGYLMVALAALFGLMSTKLALFLFVATIFMGVMISMSSILIAERQLTYFSYRDTLKMLAIALAENFGPRQVFSMWRVLGFLSAMKKPQGWGKMERKGFAKGPGGSGT